MPTPPRLMNWIYPCTVPCKYVKAVKSIFRSLAGSSVVPCPCYIVLEACSQPLHSSWIIGFITPALISRSHKIIKSALQPNRQTPGTRDYHRCSIRSSFFYRSSGNDWHSTQRAPAAVPTTIADSEILYLKTCPLFRQYIYQTITYIAGCSTQPQQKLQQSTTT
ncbi:hypothetical protein BO86DRAFT_170607 [Aspergillus japonicus CBS 114.51]|uniref:Uncharacterized protein n=1 Tax=Aspergillus japonicus CBS 114.51 TaxID=1448312 RepID=A0A8T8WUR2_ASPJA|nr:hypothetical protein BO86DRAFT_170607 [Aspergillus japonicus CBS 114.51]RAH79069.1 hypothetical protein BO86DRAFT_170607 [Aspergillus japonicus CBS 114.51]